MATIRTSWQRLALATACALSMQAHAALTLQVRVTTHIDAGPDNAAAPPDHTTQEQVIIGARYIAVKSPSSMTILDFAKRRRYAVDLLTARYVDYSLFDTVGFRVMEMQNRQNLAKVVAAAKIDTTAFDAVYNEQSLGVLAGPGETLNDTVDGGAHVLAIDGKPLLRRTGTTTPASASDAAGFASYLRYMAGAHPLVLGSLSRAHDIPNDFTLSYREAGRHQTRHYEILGVTMGAPASYDLAPYAQGSAGTDTVDQLLDKAGAMQPPARAALRATMQQQIAQAFTENRPLDAVLGASELMLMTGEPLTPFSPEQTAQLRADPVVQQVIATMPAKGKAAWTAAIPVLQQARWRKPDKAYMLTLYEANDRQSLGQLDVALPLFVTVLNTNPWLAGAYKDLGDLEFRRFDMARAWRCWDAGRRIAPGLSILATVDQFEKNLVQQHPEYF